MNKTKNGQKIQNWHRPLGPHQLGRWFRRHRHDALPEDEVWSWGFEEDRIWDEDFYYGGEADPQEADRRKDLGDDLRCAELKQLLRDIVRQPVPLFRLEGALDAALRSNDKAVDSFDLPQHPVPLEQRLAEFVRSIRYFPNDPATRRGIREAIGDDVYRDVLASAEKFEQGHYLVRNVCLFAPFWIRSPRKWDGGRNSLVQHLFGRYEIPAFFLPEWSREPGEARLKWLCWYILLAQGGSLHRAAKHFGWNIPSRLEHHLRLARPEATPAEACAFAEIRRMGGSPIDCRRILSNPAFVMDTTEASAGESSAEFWEATVRWMIAHSKALTDEQSEMVLAWAMHEYTEAERNGEGEFSLKGRGRRTALEQSLAYQDRLTRPWSFYHWRGRGWGWRPTEPALEDWSFVELTSGKELFLEGQALHHCVASYAARCAEGHSAIVSVRFQDERRVTVEIHPASRQVVQAKGMCNRQVSRDEQQLIHRWLESVVYPRSQRSGS